MKWDQSQIFERVSNIYTFSKDPLLQKNKRKHVFIPWDLSAQKDLMFKIKSVIFDQGRCDIPFMNKDFSAAKLSSEQVKSLEDQVEKGHETHLVMSNLDSIHILRVDRILKRPRALTTIDDLNSCASDIWFSVGDLFVYKANHNNDRSEIINSLDELLGSQQTQNLFLCGQSLELKDQSEEITKRFTSWLEINRNLTYDYFIRSCELQENVYQEAWPLLNRKTQHFLIMAEEARHNGVMQRDLEKTGFLKESFESYLSAVLNEMNEVYIRPLINAFNDYPCLLEAYEETSEGLINPKVKKIIGELVESGSYQIKSLELFLEYLSTAKSLLYSLKSRFTKKIGKEEYLLIESFLGRQESLVDSFTCRGLRSKLESILAIKNWLKSAMGEAKQTQPYELKNRNLKLTHLLTIMCSISYEDNVFFKLVEEKTSRGVIKRSFEDEVKALLKLEDSRKSA